MGAWCEAVTSY